MAFTLGSCLNYFVLLWERLAPSCVALCYFSAVMVAVPYFFWMGLEKVVASLIQNLNLVPSLASPPED